MRMKLIVLLALGWALSSMVVPVSNEGQPEMKIDSIIKSDSVLFLLQVIIMVMVVPWIGCGVINGDVTHTILRILNIMR